MGVHSNFHLNFPDIPDIFLTCYYHLRSFFKLLGSEFLTSIRLEMYKFQTFIIFTRNIRVFLTFQDFPLFFLPTLIIKKNMYGQYKDTCSIKLNKNKKISAPFLKLIKTNKTNLQYKGYCRYSKYQGVVNGSTLNLHSLFWSNFGNVAKSLKR